MGRGRAKAKQTKVARQLKYSAPDVDLQRLQRELAGESEPAEPSADSVEDESLDSEDSADWNDGDSKY